MYTDESKTESVNIVKPLKFTHEDGSQEDFGVGAHMVHPRVANHWFFKAHTDKAPTVNPQMGTQEYAKKMRAVREARARALEEADELVAEAEAALKNAPAQTQQPAYEDDDAAALAAAQAERERLELEEATRNPESEADPENKTAADGENTNDANGKVIAKRPVIAKTDTPDQSGK